LHPPTNEAMLTKEELLNELLNNTYVMLRQSKVAGVGVFAIRDIPKGSRNMFSKPEVNDHWITLSRAEVSTFPENIQNLITNYCLFDHENYFVPDQGFKKIDISLFLNHSDTPNVISIDDGNYFEATRDIPTGEELFIDYGTIVEDSE
jgi:SET domain-containing protein